MHLNELTAHEIHDMLIKTREVSALEVTASVLNRIDAVESKIKSFISIQKEQAIEQAKEVDKKLASGEQLPHLAGIPIAIKDNIIIGGIPTTCASKMLENFIPPYNATVVNCLMRDNPVLIGKTNMDEFGMGSSTETSHFGPTHNPWDLERVPGGSSGGSAAAIAANETILALGSDTGGSIRQPAAFCGVVGLKPTYGRVSRFGLVAYASSLDQIGPITKDVRDSAILMNYISGHDPLDSTSADRYAPNYLDALVGDVRGVKIGVPCEYFTGGIDEDVKAAIHKSINLLCELGASSDSVSLPHTEYAVPTYYVIATAEASANLARYDGVRYGHRSSSSRNLLQMYKKTRSEGFGMEVKRRIMLGTYGLSSGYYDAYYLKAQKVRTLIKEDFDAAFKQFDVLIAPVSPIPAFRLGEKIDDTLQMYLVDIYTVTINLAGLPSISIPCGFTKKGHLPIGMQIIGKPFDEENLLRVAYTFEQNTLYHHNKPPL